MDMTDDQIRIYGIPYSIDYKYRQLVDAENHANTIDFSILKIKDGAYELHFSLRARNVSGLIGSQDVPSDFKLVRIPLPVLDVSVMKDAKFIRKINEEAFRDNAGFRIADENSKRWSKYIDKPKVKFLEELWPLYWKDGYLKHPKEGDRILNLTELLREPGSMDLIITFDEKTKSTVHLDLNTITDIPENITFHKIPRLAILALNAASGNLERTGLDLLTDVKIPSITQTMAIDPPYQLLEKIEKNRLDSMLSVRLAGVPYKLDFKNQQFESSLDSRRIYPFSGLTKNGAYYFAWFNSLKEDFIQVKAGQHETETFKYLKIPAAIIEADHSGDAKYLNEFNETSYQQNLWILAEDAKITERVNGKLPSGQICDFNFLIDGTQNAMLDQSTRRISIDFAEVPKAKDGSMEFYFHLPTRSMVTPYEVPLFNVNDIYLVKVANVAVMDPIGAGDRLTFQKGKFLAENPVVFNINPVIVPFISLNREHRERMTKIYEDKAVKEVKQKMETDNKTFKTKKTLKKVI